MTFWVFVGDAVGIFAIGLLLILWKHYRLGSFR